jgi:hypothetical protein
LNGSCVTAIRLSIHGEADENTFGDEAEGNTSRGAAVPEESSPRSSLGPTLSRCSSAKTLPSTVRPGPALAVSIYSETALWMIATLRARYDVRRRRQQRGARRKRCARYNRGTGADDG